MTENKPTIYDIAQALGITPSTVSRALRNHPRISTKTKAAVQATARKLNYQQNHIAAALRSGQTYTIGVVIPYTNRNFFSSVINGIEQLAFDSGYSVIITQSNDSADREKRNIEALLRAQVDGIIISLAREKGDKGTYQQIVAQGIPLILFDRVIEVPGASTVIIDDYYGAYQATQHLIEQGCRHIAHMTGVSHLNIYKNRLRGYRDALEDHGLTYNEEFVHNSNQKVEDGREGMQQFLKLRQPPDAVLAASDYAAIGAMQVCKEKKLRIPQDVALVGFANEPLTAYLEPSLSSVDQVSEQMGHFTAKTILEAINNGKDFIPHKTVLTPELIVRESSKR
jgi:LacI family transcriptional regulator